MSDQPDHESVIAKVSDGKAPLSTALQRSEWEAFRRFRS